MDKIRDGNPSKLEVIGRCDWNVNTQMDIENLQSRTQ